ncbi:MAG TPA: hypothetical protein VK419_14455 [Bryobacteraceae bacterium]|nr:hypothetical protein [Bryobacteraceae bacterium]
MAVALLTPSAFAQSWEVGGGAGGGFYTSQDVTASFGSASAKIQSNVAGSAWLDNNSSGRWGGELRYDYQMGALQLSSGSTEATFAARTQAAHYDVLYHFAPRGAKIRPFVSAGAGIKIYSGTGTQVVYQPLSNIALLTQAQDLTPLASGGGGVKMQLASRVQLRIEVHDYLTPFPKQVITPNTGAKAGGWLQDFVPMVGISYTSPEGR